MSPNTPILFGLVAMLAAVVSILCLAAVRRRRARKQALHAEALRRKQTEPWERLSHSSAGAP